MHFYKEDGTCVDAFDIGIPRVDEAIAYCLKQGWMASVTTILGLHQEEFLIRWRVKNALLRYQETGSMPDALEYQDTSSADFGSKVHDSLENYMRDGSLSEDPLVRAHAQPGLDWLDKYVAEPILMEEALFDSELQVAGTCDLLARLKNGALWLIDFKVKKHSDRFPMHAHWAYPVQLSTYRKVLQKKYQEPIHIGNMLLASPFGWSKSPKRIFKKYEGDYWHLYPQYQKVWNYIHGDQSSYAQPYNPPVREEALCVA